MNKIVVGLIATGVVGVILVGTTVGVYTNYANFGNRTEQSLKAELQSNKAVLNNYTMKIREMAQVPDMYSDDLQKVIKETFQGRYGPQGSKAVFQFITEQNIPLDASMYKNLQQVMEAGRNDFLASQTKMLDMNRAYLTAQGNFFQGMMLRVAGYPSKDYNSKDYEPIVASEVNSKFENKQDAVIKLR